MLTCERLKEVVHYDPETGIFTWKISRGSRGAGSLAGYETGMHRIRKYKWRMIRIDSILYKESRLAWFYMTGAWPAFQLDHYDCDPLNNRWANLREATSLQNGFNRRLQRNNTTGFKGVKKTKEGRFQARITADRKTIHLGTFGTVAEAAQAYQTAAVTVHAEFARLA